MADRIQFSRFHYIGNTALRIAFWLLLKIDAQGIQHAPRQGPLLIAINHTSFLDPVLPVALLRDDVVPMAKIELFVPPIGFLYRWYGAFPIRRGEGDLAAWKYALTVLRQGHAMLISPEGRRTKSGTLEDAHEGAALLAVRSGAPVLPVGMWGGKQFVANMKSLRRAPIHVRVGMPMHVRPLGTKPTREILRSITDELMLQLAALLPVEYRGNYADIEPSPPQYLMPYQGAGQHIKLNSQEEVVPLMS